VQWEYLERFYARCGGSGGAATGATDADAERCSIEQMRALGVEPDGVLNCSRVRFSRMLWEEVETPQPGFGAPVALRIAGWAYGGPLDTDLVLRAVCAALASPSVSRLAEMSFVSAACGERWHWQDPGWFASTVPLWPHGALALAAALAVAAAAPGGLAIAKACCSGSRCPTRSGAKAYQICSEARTPCQGSLGPGTPEICGRRTCHGGGDSAAE